MFHSGSPRKGESRATTWTRKHPSSGKWYNAWLAGKPVWVLGHWIGVFKPCTKLMTNGALQCAGCAARIGCRWCGYVPLYDETHKPVFVCVGEHHEELLDKIDPFAPVIVGKGTEYHGGVFVKDNKQGPRFSSERLDRQGPADIRAWLLTLWKITELKEYFAARPEVEPTPIPPLPTIPAAIAGDELPDDQVREQLRRIQRGSVKRAPGDRLSNPNQPLTDYVQGLPAAQRIRKNNAERNGKHPPGKPS